MKNGKKLSRILRDSKEVVSCILMMLLNFMAARMKEGRRVGRDLLVHFRLEMGLGFGYVLFLCVGVDVGFGGREGWCDVCGAIGREGGHVDCWWDSAAFGREIVSFAVLTVTYLSLLHFRSICSIYSQARIDLSIFPLFSFLQLIDFYSFPRLVSPKKHEERRTKKMKWNLYRVWISMRTTNL